MGTCCSSGRRECPHHMICHGHHSLYFHPEGIPGANSFSVVYRPPHLNERLLPGESKPRFWLSSQTIPPGPPVVSVAWCQLCQKKQQGQDRKKRFRWMWRSNGNNSGFFRTGGNLENAPIQLTKDILMCGDNILSICVYPVFLAPYINKVLRLRLVLLDKKLQQRVGENGHLKHSYESDASTMTETSHLVRNMHSLKLQLCYSYLTHGLPAVTVEENHGGVKRLKRVRYRSMPVNWIDLDHRKPSITIVGEQFELYLGIPCPNLTSEDFPDGNGEKPEILGTYTRSLDTNKEKHLHFSARLFNWYNQSAPSDYLSNLVENGHKTTEEGNTPAL